MSFDIDPSENEQGHGECAAEIKRLQSQVRSLEAACAGMREALDQLGCEIIDGRVNCDRGAPCFVCKAREGDAGVELLARLEAADRLAKVAGCTVEKFRGFDGRTSAGTLEDALAEYEKSKI